MAANTKISWAHHTFNPWLGCTKVSEGCRNCYAEQLVEKRMGLKRWGNAPRVRTKQPWRDVVKWNNEAAQAGERRRVFCGSLCDVFEDAPGLDRIRMDLWQTIRECSWLDWLLLTKRPENIPRMLPRDWGDGWMHVWLGTSAENRETWYRRTWELVQVPAIVRFVSVEPLLGFIDCAFDAWFHKDYDGTRPLTQKDGARRMRDLLHWIIVGGESGAGRREMNLGWARFIRDQCREAGIAFWFKQVSAVKPGQGEDALGEIIQQLPKQRADGCRT